MVMVERAIGFAPPPKEAMATDAHQETLLRSLTEVKQGGNWFTNIFRRKHEVTASEVEEIPIEQQGVPKPPRTQTEIFAAMDAAAEQDNIKYGKLTVGLAERTVNGDGIASNDKVLGALEQQRRMDQALEVHRRELEQKSKEKKELAGVRAELAKHPHKR